jgi:hypothetical protein
VSLPITCSLTPEAIAAGRRGLLPGLADHATERHATPDGYRLTFDASSETLRQVAAVIDAERQCCRWLRFELDVQPDEGPIVLTLRGPEGATAFLTALFAE